MSYYRGKGGKLLGEGRGAGRQGDVGESGDEVVWLARDVRETAKWKQGSGRYEKPSGAKPRKRFACATCHDNCCGLARELVATAFNLGKITMSPKVLIVVNNI